MNSFVLRKGRSYTRRIKYPGTTSYVKWNVINTGRIGRRAYIYCINFNFHIHHRDSPQIQRHFFNHYKQITFTYWWWQNTFIIIGLTSFTRVLLYDIPELVVPVRRLLLTRKLLNQGFLLVKLKPSLRKFYCHHHDLVDRYGISMSPMIPDMFHLSYALIGPFLIHDWSPSFVLFLLAIVLSALRFADSDYPFGIFKLFWCTSQASDFPMYTLTKWQQSIDLTC